MARSLNFEFKLLDRLSAPARKMQAALGGTSKSLKQGRDELGRFTAGMDKAARSTFHAGEAFRAAKEAGEGLFTKLEMGLRLGERAFHLAEGIGEVAFELGKAAVEGASFHETTVVGLKTILGSAEAANRVLKETVSLTAKLPIDDQAAINTVTKFAMAGYQENQLQRLLIAASDVKGLNPGRGEEAMGLFARQIAEINQVGLGARHLLALSQETNLGEEDILKNIAKAYHLDTEKNWKATLKVLEKAMAQKAIDKTVAVNAILQTIADKEGGLLGNLSKEQGRTVGGLFSTLEGRKLLFTMDLDSSKAYGDFRHFLGLLVDATNPEGAFGQKLKGEIASAFGRTFTRLFGDFSGPDGAQKMEAGLEKVLHVAEEVEVGLEGFVAAGKGFDSALGEAVGVGGDLFGSDGMLDARKVKVLTDSFERFGHTVGELAGGLAKLVSPLERVGVLMDFMGLDSKGAETRKLVWEGIEEAVAHPMKFVDFLAPPERAPDVSPMTRLAPSSSTTRPASSRTYHVEQHQHFHGPVTPEAAREAGIRAREGMKAALDGQGDESEE